MNEILLTFANTHGAIHCERVLMSDGIPVKVTALPSEIGTDCALCARIDEQHLDASLALLNRKAVRYSGIYKRTMAGDKPVWKAVK